MTIPIPQVFFGSSKSSFTNVSSLISTLLPNLLVGAGVIMLFLMLGGGFMIIHGAGNDDTKQAAQGKAAVTSAVIGFLLVISAYFILQIVGTVTGVDFINPKTLP